MNEAALREIRGLIKERKQKEALRKALSYLQKFPREPELLISIGVCLVDLGQIAEAKDFLERAIALRPDRADYWMTWGRYLSFDQDSGAEAALKQALELRPNYPEARFHLAALYSSQQRITDAIREAEETIARDPHSSQGYLILGSILRDIGRPDEALVVYREGLKLIPGEAGIASNIAFTMNYIEGMSGEEIANDHLAFGRIVESEIAPGSCTIRDVNPDRRLRIAYLSQDFRDHAVSYFLEGLLNAHDRSQVEVFAYFDQAKGTERTSTFQEIADTFRFTGALSDRDFEDMLGRDKIDILIELAGHTTNERWRVFAKKVVPLQITYLGYPNSTGLRSIDARIIDSITDPVDTDIYYTEKLLRIEAPFLSYTPPKDIPDIGSLPALKGSGVTFGSFNALAKLQPRVIEVWCKILKRTNNSRLLLKSRTLSDPGVISYFMDAFKRHGIDEDQLELVGFREERSHHLELYNEVDLGLDPFPYNGTTTTCEALWMGVPVLTCIGRAFQARVAASLLGAVELPELVTGDRRAFEDLAVALAGDKARLARLKQHLAGRRERLPLYDTDRLRREIEWAYAEMWSRCRSGRGAQPIIVPTGV